MKREIAFEIVDDVEYCVTIEWIPRKMHSGFQQRKYFEMEIFGPRIIMLLMINRIKDRQAMVHDSRRDAEDGAIVDNRPTEWIGCLRL